MGGCGSDGANGTWFLNREPKFGIPILEMERSVPANVRCIPISCDGPTTDSYYTPFIVCQERYTKRGTRQ